MPNNKNNNKSKKPKQPLIYERISKIMAEMPAIGKDAENKAQHFKYRSIDAIMDVVHGLLAQHNVFYTPHVASQDRQILDRMKEGVVVGKTVIVALSIEYKVYCSEDRSEITVGPIIGEAMDTGDKASAKAMTMALKTMLLQLFCIPVLNAYDPDGNGSPKPATQNKSKAKDLLKPEEGNGNGKQDIAAKKKFRQVVEDLAGEAFEPIVLKVLCEDVMEMAKTKDIGKAADWLKDNAVIDIGDVGEPILRQLQEAK